MNSFSWKTMRDKIRKMKRTDWLVVLLGGVLLLIIAIPAGGGREEGKDKDSQAVEGEETGAKEANEKIEYRREMEKELEELLGQMEGVGKVKVMLTLKDQGEEIPDKNVSSGADDYDSTTVVYRNEDGESPYITRRLYPDIEGVVIVAEGGGSPGIVNDISDAVMALFGVELHKIKIVKMRV